MALTPKIILLFFCLVYCNLFGIQEQIKFEKEQRIKKVQVPQNALSFIDSCFTQKKIKWFAEKSQDGKTFEAKAKYNNYRYSIEFDTSGNLIDIEKTIPYKSLPTEIKTKINLRLSKAFLKPKIIKIQEQWVGNKKALLQLIKKGNTSEQYVLNYEIVLKAKKSGAFKMFEVLINTNGEIIKTLEIIERNTDNLEF
ncbi:hypothetical protein D1816_07810 [Aquimarina sp. AD10]|uniref:hypothetical protein n=1 Tax=Aquimarina sp. AD10 TaxID=1714849 RepID=UPI000E496AA4|nr:hypothetical protein [Aquimarina sp. AD10]AXT60257.1 hypothetical protein D1816_07810 [Aquimarina sp. AD10]RKN01308.1 hypothetical protein D7033_05670 [Aquimarina sp. AD10]